jgi:hypothetical protein
MIINNCLKNFITIEAKIINSSKKGKEKTPLGKGRG